MELTLHPVDKEGLHNVYLHDYSHQAFLPNSEKRVRQLSVVGSGLCERSDTDPALLSCTLMKRSIGAPRPTATFTSLGGEVTDVELSFVRVDVRRVADVDGANNLSFKTTMCGREFNYQKVFAEQPDLGYCSIR